MSSGDGSTRRSRRTPSTPSRYGKDFIMETSVTVKKEVTEATDAPRKSPRGSSTSDHIAPVKTVSHKQNTPRQSKGIVTRTTRNTSKRASNSVEELPEDGLSGKKKRKPTKAAEDRKITAESEKSVDNVAAGQDREDTITDVSKGSDGKPSDGDNEVKSGIDKKSVQNQGSSSTSPSPSKNKESEERIEVQPSAEDISTSQEHTTKVINTPRGSQPVVLQSTSSVFKELKQAVVASKATLSGESGGKKKSTTVPVKSVQPSSPGKSSPAKVKSVGKSSVQPSSPGKSSPAKVKSVGKSSVQPSSPGKSSPAKVKSVEVPKSKDSSAPASPKPTTPIKRVHINIIRSNQAGHVGIIAGQGNKQNPEVKREVNILPLGKAKATTSNERSKAMIVTTDMLSNIRVKGRTMSTQTSHNDLQVAMYINKNVINNCAHKVIKVSRDKITKPNFRTANTSQMMKHSQTKSEFSDMNFTILEAIGKEEEMVNNNSLSFVGEESSDVDKKIQWMLFGQDLESAMTDCQGGIPSNVVGKGDSKGGKKPQNAKISIESWSLALTVLNPNV